MLMPMLIGASSSVLDLDYGSNYVRVRDYVQTHLQPMVSSEVVGPVNMVFQTV